MSEKMREEFEAWFLIVTGVDVKSNRDGNGYRCDDDESTRYLSGAWLSWKASRATLVAELPQKPYCVHGMAYPDYSDALKDCRRAIESVCVKCKLPHCKP